MCVHARKCKSAEVPGGTTGPFEFSVPRTVDILLGPRDQTPKSSGRSLELLGSVAWVFERPGGVK
eukprot:4204156-Pyramimonas_sp.AAC.1